MPLSGMAHPRIINSLYSICQALSIYLETCNDSKMWLRRILPGQSAQLWWTDYNIKGHECLDGAE